MSKAAMRYVRGHHPDVLVLDLNMPGGSSLEAIPAHSRRGAANPDRRPDNAGRAGIRTRKPSQRAPLATSSKRLPTTELVEAVRRAAAGETYLNPRTRSAPIAPRARRLASRRSQQPRGRSAVSDRARSYEHRDRWISSSFPSAPSKPTGRTSSRSFGSHREPSSSATRCSGASSAATRLREGRALRTRRVRGLPCADTSREGPRRVRGLPCGHAA